MSFVRVVTKPVRQGSPWIPVNEPIGVRSPSPYRRSRVLVEDRVEDQKYGDTPGERTTYPGWTLFSL